MMATTNLVVNFSAGAIAGEWRGSVDDRIANAVLSLLVASSQMQKQIAATSTPTEPKDEQQAPSEGREPHDWNCKSGLDATCEKCGCWIQSTAANSSCPGVN